jgi:hypothetical protein
MVKLMEDNGNEQKVRALIQTGSQRSNMLKETVTDLGYQSVGSEIMTRGLLGGAKSREKNNSLYKRKVYSWDGIFLCEKLVLDQTVICRKIPRLEREPWTRESKE